MKNLFHSRIRVYFLKAYVNGFGNKNSRKKIPIMRIASGIISLVLGVMIFLQSCTISIGGDIFGDKASSSSGSIGLLVAFLLFLAGAFAFTLPKVAMIFSTIAALFAFLNGATSDFSDMTVWGVIALVIAVLNFFAGRSQKPRRM